MEYIVLNCHVDTKGDSVDIMIALLGELGYEAFEETEEGVTAYIKKELFKEEDLLVFKEMRKNGFAIEFNHELMPDRNWNALWESNFEPVTIGNKVSIRAEFHPQQKDFPYEILIQPRMAFGTGHHATTALMMERMLEMEWNGKEVLDMGCGTGILAILASQLGALKITAIDIDEIAVANTLQNVSINNCPTISAWRGEASSLEGLQFEIILAYINRNILLNDMQRYVASMKKDAYLLVSGFYEVDNALLKECAFSFGLKLLKESVKDQWSCLVFQKKV